MGGLHDSIVVSAPLSQPITAAADVEIDPAVMPQTSSLTRTCNLVAFAIL